MPSYPLKLKPIVKKYIWGTENWIFSTHPAGQSIITNGEYTGQTLKSVTGDLSILIKLIEANDMLSLQVHPDDEYAQRTEGQNALPGERVRGKNEMWYVIKAEPEAVLILGVKGAYGRDELRRLIESGEITSAVRRVPVKAGDCYSIPAGLLHSIGKGISILEVQQSSNFTYRMYDFGRTDSTGKPRELHIDKALDVLDTNLAALKADSSILTNWEYFKSKLITVERDAQYNRQLIANSMYECLVVADIEGEENSKNNTDVILKYIGGELTLQKSDAVYIPAGCSYTLGTTGARALVMSSSETSINLTGGGSLFEQHK